MVEFPLSPVVRESLQDGRTHGLALLVGRNIDRGDAGVITPPPPGVGGHCHTTAAAIVANTVARGLQHALDGRLA